MPVLIFHLVPGWLIRSRHKLLISIYLWLARWSYASHEQDK